MVDTGLIYVVVVDPSPMARQELVGVLEAAPGVQIVGTGADGDEALRLARRLKPTVMVMDMRLPKLTGLEVIKRIMREMPTRIVVISDGTSNAHSDLYFDVLQAGALMVTHKPKPSDPDACAELIRTVKLMADVPVVHHWGRRALPTAPETAGGARGEAASRTRMRATSEIKILGIAASTGGPAALATVLGALPVTFPLPILVVQHMAQGFTAVLVQWLATRMALSVALAVDGSRPIPGSVLVAPDDQHMRVSPSGFVVLTREPPYKGLRPSANPLFFSLADVFGSAAMGIILTGMGDDGVEGLAALHRKGGPVIAQDEATSVVYGMPQQAVARGVVDDVLSLPLIARALAEWRSAEKVKVL